MKYIVQRFDEGIGLWLMHGGVVYSHPSGAKDEAQLLNSRYDDKFRAIGFVEL